MASIFCPNQSRKHDHLIDRSHTWCVGDRSKGSKIKMYLLRTSLAKPEKATDLRGEGGERHGPTTEKEHSDREVESVASLEPRVHIFAMKHAWLFVETEPSKLAYNLARPVRPSRTMASMFCPNQSRKHDHIDRSIAHVVCWQSIQREQGVSSLPADAKKSREAEAATLHSYPRIII